MNQLIYERDKWPFMDREDYIRWRLNQQFGLSEKETGLSLKQREEIHNELRKLRDEERNR